VSNDLLMLVLVPVFHTPHAVNPNVVSLFFILPITLYYVKTSFRPELFFNSEIQPETRI